MRWIQDVLRLAPVPLLVTEEGVANIEGPPAGGSLVSGPFLAEGARLTRTIEPAPEGWLRLCTRLDALRDLHVVRFAECFFVPMETPDYLWTPNLAPEQGDTQGDHCFRAPVLLLHRGSRAVALVPDIETLSRERHSDLPPPGCEEPPPPQIKGYADLVRDDAARGYRLENGRANYDIRAHVYYAFNGVPYDLPAGHSLETACYLRVVDDHAEPRDIRYAVRFLWQKYAGEGMASTLPQMRPFDAYSDKSFDAIEAEGDLPAVALPDGTQGTALVNGFQRSLEKRRHDYFRIPAACMWFSAWFNGLRVAIGLRLHAQRVGGNNVPHRIALANGIRDVLRRAPDPTGRGLIPQLFDPHDHTWWNSVSRLTPAGDACGFDLSASAHTGLLMLWWHRLVDADAVFLERCRHLGASLMAMQGPAGGFPAFTREDGTPCSELADNGHSGMVAWFLSELHAVTGEAEVRESVLRACRFFETIAIPENRFQDFETYFSCSDKPLDFFDLRTGQPPQNSLPIYWMAETLSRAADWTGERRWREAARHCFDRLALYQQVWRPPFFQGYAFGGFGVMNTDGEWNDMRQSKFALGYLREYLRSGLPEDFERGVAALRAGYLLYCDPLHRDLNPLRHDLFREGLMPENYAHNGNERHAVMSGFDWGAGMQATMCELALRRYGGIFVHLDHRHAFGLDGCTVRSAEFDFEARHVHLRVHEATGISRPIDVVVDRQDQTARVRIDLAGGTEQKLTIHWSEQRLGVGCVEGSDDNELDSFFSRSDVLADR